MGTAVSKTATTIKDIPSAYKALSILEQMPKRVVLQLKDQFFREDLLHKYLEFCRTHIDKESIEYISAQELLSQKSVVTECTFFFASRLWVLSDVGSLRGKKAEELVQAISMSEDYFCIVGEEGVPKALLEGAFAMVLTAPKPWDRPALLSSWLRSYCKKKEVAIDGDALEFFVSAATEQREQLVQEVEKVLTYALDKPSITLEDVKALVLSEQRSTLWQLLDALLHKDRKALLLAFEHLEDSHEIAIVRFVKSQLQKLVLAQGAAPSKTQEKRRAMVRTRKKEVIGWINALEMRDVAIRSGTQEGDLAFFLLSTLR